MCGRGGSGEQGSRARSEREGIRECDCGHAVPAAHAGDAAGQVLQHGAQFDPRDRDCGPGGGPAGDCGAEGWVQHHHRRAQDSSEAVSAECGDEVRRQDADLWGDSIHERRGVEDMEDEDSREKLII